MNKILIFITSIMTFQGPLGLKAWVSPNAEWNIVSSWSKDANNYYSATFENKSLLGLCKNNTSAYIDFPTVIIASHEIFLDEKLAVKFSDPKFKETRSFYGAPFLECSKTLAARNLKWKITTVIPYFAKINTYPKLIQSKPIRNLFQEVFNIISFGGLLVLALVNYIVFYGKLRTTIVVRSVLSCVFMGLYFLGTVSGLFEIKADVFYIHKFADLSMWIGGYMYYSIFRIDNFFNKKVYLAHEILIGVGVFIILFAPSISIVQLGTSLPFPMTILATPLLMSDLFRNIKNNLLSKAHILRILSLGVFIFGVINDILVVSGASSNFTFLASSALAAHIFLTISVHEKILETYRERDHLRKNLQDEVEAKTRELKEAQGELIQSAKLASLGTLSAGIAHEINNSLNYVNGSIRPLEKIFSKIEDENLKKKGHSLLTLMKEGLKLTFDIIRSLKNYTGLNQANMKRVPLQEIISTVTTILRSKLSPIELDIKIDPRINVYADVVSLNQVFMNLITNAVDAMPPGGILKIWAVETSDYIEINVKDNGVGMSQEGLSKIFDPFYTTKEVGKGTGLGLHICKKEIERHGGQLNVQTSPGKGTTFTVKLNKVGDHTEG